MFLNIREHRSKTGQFKNIYFVNLKFKCQSVKIHQGSTAKLFVPCSPILILIIRPVNYMLETLVILETGRLLALCVNRFHLQGTLTATLTPATPSLSAKVSRASQTTLTRHLSGRAMAKYTFSRYFDLNFGVSAKFAWIATRVLISQNWQ